MGPKGRITVPAALRRRYGLEGGGTVIFRVEKGRIVMEPDHFGAKSDNEVKAERQIPFGNDNQG